jgi:hypothetical protein
MAQVIERAVEPFSEVDLTHAHTGGGLFSDTDAITMLQVVIKDLQNKKDKDKEEESRLARYQGLLDKLQAKRTIAFWGLTSLMGMILSYFTSGLFEIVGATFQTIVIAGANITGHAIDSILSGMIIGGGTKPLHDLIGYLESAKQS